MSEPFSVDPFSDQPYIPEPQSIDDEANALCEAEKTKMLIEQGHVVDRVEVVNENGKVGMRFYFAKP